MWTRTLTNDQAYFLGESRKGTSSGLIQLWMLLPAETWLEHHPVVSDVVFGKVHIRADQHREPLLWRLQSLQGCVQG
ncbi:MAG: hypothetical protein AAF627_20480 [Myxococcota bacterium]